MRKIKIRLPNGAIYPYSHVEVGCGKCIACKINKSTEWTIRLLHEKFTSKKRAYVLTLTYDDNHITPNQSLVKSDLQKFFKRLRKKYDIKYYSCGEYGGRTQRPHYHAVIIGDLPKGLTKHTKYYSSKEIRKLWNYGMNTIIPFNKKTARYCTKYIQKYNTQDYKDNTRQKPFCLCSNGLGKSYALKNREKILNDGKIILDGQIYPIPRYYLKLYNLPKLLSYKNIRNKIRNERVQMYKLKCNRTDLRRKMEDNGDVKTAEAYARQKLKEDKL